jgi:hypothetical protein
LNLLKLTPIPSIEFVDRSHTLESKSTARRATLIWLIVSQLLALASLFFWLFAAGISVMAFDSGATPEAWAFVIAVWSYPIWPIIFTIAAWMAYARKKDRLAGVLTTLTFLPVLILILTIVFSSFYYTFFSPFKLESTGLL